MPIPYKTVKITNPLGSDKTGKYYAKVKCRGEYNFRELSKEISGMSTLSTPDITAVLESFIEIIPDLLLRGYIVKLGDFGSFIPTIKSDGALNEKDFTSKMIKKTIMQFRPGKYMKKQLKSAKYKKL